MLFLILRRVARHLSSRSATAVVVLVLALQIADIGGHLGAIRRLNERPARYAWRRPLQWETWRFVADGNQGMVIVPSKEWDADTKAAFTWLAGRSGLAINIGDPSRVDMAALYSANQALAHQIASGPLDAATIYIVHPGEFDAFAAVHHDIACRAVDGYHACTGGTRDAGLVK